mmetsp:Transcript_61054/g.72493  ORF Transcript_61054/g.72493 Transcript_61054/m.72493 type:complete len:144 (-) Transcript_61054:155-586(-)|eukprot:CAMPEP_0172501884 /NCGR_PEP_ID=MMETSP1066-20121228/154754_1 /TAXON_ID=671091 /ORGANISM="Coscinodiscus wailesii, Strain CCMP2513" /LENGTH=143 /DNA_ID=CAMNT_0013276925 /DNA_START=221 /DNA_END=652 /DNA_ORIENTATION=+
MNESNNKSNRHHYHHNSTPRTDTNDESHEDKIKAKLPSSLSLSEKLSLLNAIQEKRYNDGLALVNKVRSLSESAGRPFSDGDCRILTLYAIYLEGILQTQKEDEADDDSDSDELSDGSLGTTDDDDDDDDDRGDDDDVGKMFS